MLAGYLITVMKLLTAEICVSEESLDLITDSIIVVLILLCIKAVRLALSQHQEHHQANTSVLVIWLVVLLTQPFQVEEERVITLDHLVLVGADSVLAASLK